MFLLEWLAGLLVRLVVGLTLGLVGDQINQRRAAELLKKRMDAFRDGKEVRIPCAMRHGQATRWRHGHLRLAKGAGAWVPRLRRQPLLTFNRGTAVGQYGRQAHGRATPGIGRRLAVVAYRIDGDTVELALRQRDLALLGRVVELPPTSL